MVCSPSVHVLYAVELACAFDYDHHHWPVSIGRRKNCCANCPAFAYIPAFSSVIAVCTLIAPHTFGHKPTVQQDDYSFGHRLHDHQRATLQLLQPVTIIWNNTWVRAIYLTWRCQWWPTFSLRERPGTFPYDEILVHKVSQCSLHLQIFKLADLPSTHLC